LKDLRTDNIYGTNIPIKSVFANLSMDLLGLTNIVKHGHSPRGDRKCLLPDDNSGGQPHLENRWLYFLGNNVNVLTPQNHQIIRQLISMVLNDTSYDHIDFDCIDWTPQTVFYADEFDSSGAKYLRIVLSTPPLNKFLGDPNLELDPQGGYSFNFVPVARKGDGDGDDDDDNGGEAL
jgi:hypothetical protein